MYRVYSNEGVLCIALLDFIVPEFWGYLQHLMRGRCLISCISMIDTVNDKLSLLNVDLYKAADIKTGLRKPVAANVKPRNLLAAISTPAVTRTVLAV